MIKRIFAAALTALAFSSPTLLGQTIKDGPHLALPQGGDVEDEQLGVGWQVTYEFNDTLSLDLSVTRQEDHIDSRNLHVGAFPDEGGIDLDIWAFALTARAGFLLGNRAYLYGGGGLGYYFFNEDSQDIRKSLAASPVTGGSGGQITTVGLDIESNVGYHLAGGLEFHLHDAWEMFVEYRLVYFDTDAGVTIVETLPVSDVGKSKLTSTSNGTFDYDYALLRFGINYRF